INLQSLGDAGAVVFHQHVGCFDQLIERFQPRFRLEIDFYAAFVAIQRQEAAAVLAGELETHGFSGLIADTGGFYFDYVRAHIAKQHAAEGASHDLADVKDADGGERKIHNDSKEDVK